MANKPFYVARTSSLERILPFAQQLPEGGETVTSEKLKAALKRIIGRGGRVKPFTSKLEIVQEAGLQAKVPAEQPEPDEALV